ncbi:LuxR C-terminal-related transcriptional regulator [Streptomyces sp. 4503]|uniref:LuxR C-terminal-related transcriptional regulator n=1 Tax=Streptomyces niphimycinicus TaxID=2842201 RepID=A0ABS6CQG6_9ACTN|nr:LuxR C-terminal-related transcriptional regulator [Streptomyces niphimycinicus]MBU3868981.1 LuxR C-terminal-related transcriptional regulator [Streptomyces niphimycinicus]
MGRRRDRARNRTVHEGDPVLAPALIRTLIERTYTTPPPSPAPPGAADALSTREQETLDRLGRGPGNRAIATELHVAETTVRTYVSRLLTKPGLVNRTQATLYGGRPRPGAGSGCRARCRRAHRPGRRGDVGRPCPWRRG